VVATVTSTPPVDPLDDRAVYKQIADRLRDLLDMRELRPGDKLPSESALMRRFGTSRATIRNALGQLTQEGRLRTERGVGVFVADASRLVLHDPASFVRGRNADEPESPLERDARGQDFEYRQRALELREVGAPERVAALLKVAPGDQVFVRKRLVSTRPKGSRWAPAKIADSYLPPDIAVGRIREPDTGPGGTYARIREHGHQLTHFDEHLIFRMPDPSEARRLRLGAGIPVIDQTRVAHAGDRPVECFLAVLAGDKNQIEYRIPATQETVTPPTADTTVAPLAQGQHRKPRMATEVDGSIDATGDRPVYKQIADLVREHIDRGELVPGDKLPSESALMRRFDVTRTTVRRAIQSLVAEGRIRTERGVGAFVKEVVRADALVRQPYDRLARHHYRDEGKSGLDIDAESRGFTHEHVRQDRVDLADVRAPTAVAEWLAIDPGSTVFRRRRRMWTGNLPTQLTNSYLPAELAVGPLREVDMGDGGAHARLEDLGYRLTHFVERLSVRMPYPKEARALRLEQGVPVVDLFQTAYADDTPVECFTSVIAGDRYVFTYRIDA